MTAALGVIVPEVVTLAVLLPVSVMESIVCPLTRVPPVTLTMSAASGKSINHCLRYLSNNPRCVKRVTIAAMTNPGGMPKPDAYNASMLLASLNPFQKEAAREVDMSQYFQTNQFQSGKIVIDYNYGDLEWNDLLYWAIEVTGATTLKVTIDFYPDENNA